ncbi:type II secretion system F family protein [Arthrobacter crystallopoietes]|uniref:Tight adherence protein C n=1 Tax=Crystallibacter crystallopoietes TaxID=37928 RepID=A0A1H1F337_9MICC|nr:type II secretion system F family protein [Arthrobacter crystallopoietes]AUI49661.1 secretion system protein [Arthrobacter crystallopoietes]SDQ95321.1 tight adherence protein C [Arthrobacter crystallopoietes]
MNLLVVTGALLICCSVTYVAWALLAHDKKGLHAVRANLRRGFEAEGPSSRRDLGPLYQLGERLTPSGYAKKLDQFLALAGRPATMPLNRLLAAKPALAGLGALLAFLMIKTSPTSTTVFLGIFLTLLGYFAPDLMLYSKGLERQQSIQMQLANTLDQMLISVEAGLGFEAAMARAGANGKGPLAEELVRTLQDMQVGRSRRESYLALADRTNVPELRSFVKTIVQADAYGIALSGVLRTQAKVMRVKRRQRAEEKAMKLPVKVLFPLLFFIFPVLFIVVMGPAVLNLMDTFSGS